MPQTSAQQGHAGACAITSGEIADLESMTARHYSVFTVRAKRLRRAVRDALVMLVMGETTD
jgi:hypothetical protein